MEHQDMTGISILFVDDEKLIRNFISCIRLCLEK